MPIVKHFLGREGIILDHWHASPVPYTTFLAGRTLRSVVGTAVVGNERIPWKLILKIIRAPEVVPAQWANNMHWAREVDAYRSGLLDDLPGNLRAPRAIHVAG